MKCPLVRYGLLIFFLAGCAHKPVSYHDILEKASEINRAYGVTQEEAVILAQEFLIGKSLRYRLYSFTPYKVARRVYFLKDGKEIDFVSRPAKNFQLPTIDSWSVYFKDKEGSLLWGWWPIKPLVVEVDAKTGQIINWERKF